MNGWHATPINNKKYTFSKMNYQSEETIYEINNLFENSDNYFDMPSNIIGNLIDFNEIKYVQCIKILIRNFYT